MKTTIVTMAMLALSLATTALGAEKTKPSAKRESMQMTSEQRKSMATAHEKMAECLRSDKAFDACQKEMMQSCQEMMGKDGCPMMGQMSKMHGKMEKGMMHRHGMMDESDSKSGATGVDDSKKQTE